MCLGDKVMMMTMMIVTGVCSRLYWTGKIAKSTCLCAAIININY